MSGSEQRPQKLAEEYKRQLLCHLQALEALAKLKKEKTQEAKELRLKLENLRTHRDAAQQLRAKISQGTASDTEHMQRIQDFEDQMQVSMLVNRPFDASCRSAYWVRRCAL